MIEIRNLTKCYGDRKAIDRISFNVKKGEVVGFLGPNGAGKSTTMKIITGFMAPTEGEAIVDGLDVFEFPLEVKRKIGYLPETPPLYGDMIVRDYLKFVAQLKGVDRKNVSEYVRYAIEKTNLGEVQHRLIQNLSKGFRQRVGIAQAIVSKPEVLILDEPTVGLDPRQVSEIRNLLKELRGHHTIILSTHILSEVQATCDRIIIINDGRIAIEDTLTDINQKINRTGTVQLRVRRKADELAVRLKTISGVERVDVQGLSIKVLGAVSEEFIERISAEAVGQDSGLLELNPNAAALEDMFIQMTSHH